MGKFGFEPCDDGGPSKPPNGYATATVCLGEHRETVYFWLKLWSASDYVEHWRGAAAALLGGKSPTLFCADYAAISCSCFVGWPNEDGYVFEEWVIKRDELARDGLHLSYVGADNQPNSEASHFHVPTDDVQAFVQSRP